MDSIYLCAYAKINIALEIIGKRADGYHELRTIMQTVSLYDSIYMNKAGNGIRLDTNVPDINNCSNLVYRAAEYLIDRYRISGGIRVYLKKRIPISAGLGGGSSDCAAVIRGMNGLFGLNMSFEDMMSVGALFGSDVPFFMIQGTALAEGRGERLKTLHPHPDAFVLIAKHGFDVSTKDIFGAYRQNNSIRRPDITAMANALKNNDLACICSNLCNMLESVTVKKYPVIEELKNLMLLNGSLGALMSGSGPSVFGYFSDMSGVSAASEAVKKAFPGIEVHVCRIV